MSNSIAGITFISSSEESDEDKIMKHQIYSSITAIICYFANTRKCFKRAH